MNHAGFPLCPTLRMTGIRFGRTEAYTRGFRTRTTQAGDANSPTTLVS
jgi:hypothetical protein